MIYFLVFIAGLLLACMQSFNGLLSNYIGTYGTSLIVHCIGAVMLLIYLLIKKERVRLYPMPWYLYSAGIFGLVLVAFTSVSGDVTPSPNDITATQAISEAGRTVGIPLLDHLIVGNNSYLSFREQGLLPQIE